MPIMTTMWFLALVGIASCAPVSLQSRPDRPSGDGYASSGDIVLRVNRVDDLPNAFGRADVFGRTRDRGFVEVRYMGINAAGLAVFRRRDIEIMTNETTMSRGIGISTYTAQGNAQRAGALGNAAYSEVGTTLIPAQAHVTALPPDTVEIVVDPRHGRTITVGNNGVEIIEATSSGVRFRTY